MGIYVSMFYFLNFRLFWVFKWWYWCCRCCCCGGNYVSSYTMIFVSVVFDLNLNFCFKHQFHGLTVRFHKKKEKTGEKKLYIYVEFDSHWNSLVFLCAELERNTFREEFSRQFVCLNSAVSSVWLNSISEDVFRSSFPARIRCVPASLTGSWMLKANSNCNDFPQSIIEGIR